MRFLLAACVVVVLAGCNPTGFPLLSKQAGYSAPADFTRGVGEVSFLQSADGETVFWDCPYYNASRNVSLYTVQPCITVKDDKGRVIWVGNDERSWRAKPGEQGHVGGKIVIPEAVLKPTLKWENGGAASACAERKTAN